MDKVNYEMRPYTKWYKKNNGIIRDYNKQEYEPLITVVVPVYNVADNQLIACIESVCNQTYSNWELILVDDNSSWESVRVVLRNYEYNPRINVIYREENGNISVATNDGIFAATGEFIAFIDCDDTIEACALAEMIYYINDNPDTDFIYSDADQMSEDGCDFHNPFFRPDWSPDTFLSLMYANHLSLYRRDIVCKVGGLRSEYNGAQDYDFTLRFMEASDNKRVGHIPKVLYHWREREESTANSNDAKPYALEAMKHAKEDALKRRGIEATLEFLDEIHQYQINYITTGNPLVSIVIPSKDNPDILIQCIDSIYKKTTYKNYEIIVVDNGSDEFNRKRISNYLDEVKAKYIYQNMEFNFSKMCNMGVKASEGDYVLLLNDDIEVINNNWLDRMLGQAMQSHAGAVGAKLLFPNSDIVQHIGICNLPVGPCHMYMGASDSEVFYFGRNRLTYNWLAVTGACLLVSKAKYNEVGGLDEGFSVAYNDVDFCFKLYKAGYYNSSRMDISLYHHESYSRGYDDVSDEKKIRLQNERNRLYSKHRDLFAKDPFHNVNFGVDRTDYDINMYDVGVHNYDVVLSNRCYKPKATTLSLNIDYVIKDDMVRIGGWAFSDNIKRDLFSKRYLMLKNKAHQIYLVPVEKTVREDLSESASIENLTEGFECVIDRKILATNVFDYYVGLLQVESDGNENYVWSDKKIHHDGVDNVDYKYYSRNARFSSIEECGDIVGDIDQCARDSMVVTKYGSFNDMTYIKGWAFMCGSRSCDYRIEVGIVSEDDMDSITLYDTLRLPRFDVAASLELESCYMSGFQCELPMLIDDRVKVYIVLNNMTNGKCYKRRLDVNYEAR